MGSQYLVDLSMSDQNRHDAVMAVVRQTFKPEFLNRLDDIVMFDALTTGELAKIVKIQIASLSKRLADRRLTLDVSPAAVEWLSLNGFDPIYGARPLRRLIQTAIGDKLAREILSGHVQDGSVVAVDVDAVTEGLSLSAQ